MLSISTDVAKPSSKWLRAQIDSARRIDAAMPELRLAELELLPTTDFAGRIGLVNSLRQEHPDDMFVLGARAEQLMLVGRNNEAVVDAERTARPAVDPAAIANRGGRDVVCVVKEGKLAEVPIETGAKIGDLMEIRRGPQPGEKVVLRPLAKFHDGAAVRSTTK